MDINQAAQMIEWLDEERRRDKSMIATLEERLAQQQETIEGLLRRVNSVESDQGAMRSQFVPSGRDSDILDQMRKELQQSIENVEAKRLTNERETERRAELSRENSNRPVRDLTEKVSKLEKQVADFPTLQVERDRLENSVQVLQQRLDDLLKRLEEPERRLAFLEEQRRQDARRISEIQTETPDIQKQVDNIRPKMDLLEDLALRNERRIQEAQNIETERRDQIQQFVDQQTLLLQQRDQQIDDLIKRFGEHDSEMQNNMERFESWSETYRSMKQIIEDFERIGDRLERRINEVAEMQRLSEERFRQEWNDWTSDDQKRWKQFTLSNDEVWRTHDKEFERFVLRLAQFEKRLPMLQDGLERLWNLERARAELYRERYQALLLEHDTNSSLESVPISNNGTTN